MPKGLGRGSGRASSNCLGTCAGEPPAGPGELGAGTGAGLLGLLVMGCPADCYAAAATETVPCCRPGSSAFCMQHSPGPQAAAARSGPACCTSSTCIPFGPCKCCATPLPGHHHDDHQDDEPEQHHHDDDHPAHHKPPRLHATMSSRTTSSTMQQPQPAVSRSPSQLWEGCRWLRRRRRLVPIWQRCRIPASVVTAWGESVAYAGMPADVTLPASQHSHREQPCL